MKKTRQDESFIKKPYYNGGNKAMSQLVKENLKYPKQALENKVEGSVKLRYDIDYKGNVTGSKVISSLGHGCDEEAQRLVKLFKFIVPKNPRKLKITFHKTITIHFRLPVQKPKPKKQVAQKTEFVYSVSSKKNNKEENSSGYTYTITLK